jgi:hypothetical protein
MEEDKEEVNMPQTLEGHCSHSSFHFRSKTQHLKATDYSYWFNYGFHLLKKDLEQKDLKTPISILLPCLICIDSGK